MALTKKHIKLNFKNAISFENHRSGWSYAIKNLLPLHAKDGLYVEDFMENTFGWKYCNQDPDSYKDIYYHDKTYKIKYKNVRLHNNNHAVKLNSNLYIRYNRSDKKWRQIKDMTADKWKNTEYAFRNVVYKMPWIGFMHNVPSIPIWFDYHNSPYQILNHPEVRESLQHCEGIYVLSDYLKDWLTEFFKQSKIKVPVNTLIHPTETPNLKFKWSKFVNNTDKKIVQIGYWLRKMSHIWDIRTEFKKVWLYGDNYAINCLERELLNSKKSNRNDILLNKLRQYNNHNGKKILDVKLSKISNSEYDKLLTKNICVLNLYDSSCNNTIIECIVRHTPIIVNKLPAVVEYLGEEYPLYADTIEEVENILKNNKLIKKAHLYLKKMDKTKFTGESFLKSLMNSKIYKALVKKFFGKRLDQPIEYTSNCCKRTSSSGAYSDEQTNCCLPCR